MPSWANRAAAACPRWPSFTREVSSTAADSPKVTGSEPASSAAIYAPLPAMPEYAGSAPWGRSEPWPGMVGVPTPTTRVRGIRSWHHTPVPSARLHATDRDEDRIDLEREVLDLGGKGGSSLRKLDVVTIGDEEAVDQRRVALRLGPDLIVVAAIQPNHRSGVAECLDLGHVGVEVSGPNNAASIPRDRPA